MLMMWFACSGAGLRTSSPASGALVLTLALTLTSVTQVSAVCVHCKGFVDGCTGSDTCPLATEITANGAAMEDPKTSKIPTVGYILPPDMLTVFTNNVIEAIVGIASSPATGRTVDLSDNTEFDKPSKVVRAAFMGHCTIEEAGLELAGRLEDATEMVDVTKVQSAIELLKTRQGLPTKECMQAGQGVYTFIFAKVGQYLEGVKKGTVRLASSAAKAAASDLVATIRAPESSHEFFFMLNDWALVVSALGLIAYPLIIRFIKDTVEYTMVCLKETYQVACCLFLTYLKRIETDPTRTMTLANAYRNGSSDTFLSEARQMVATFFRSRGGIPRGEEGDDKFKDPKDSNNPKGKVEWNGKCTDSAKRACAAFNFGTKHRANALDDSGCCKFAHVCNQWVDDKGPSGMCFGKHKKSECDYDPAHKIDKPLP